MMRSSPDAWPLLGKEVTVIMTAQRLHYSLMFYEFSLSVLDTHALYFVLSTPYTLYYTPYYSYLTLNVDDLMPRAKMVGLYLCSHWPTTLAGLPNT